MNSDEPSDEEEDEESKNDEKMISKMRLCMTKREYIDEHEEKP